jgi:hypothetical protein
MAQMRRCFLAHAAAGTFPHPLVHTYVLSAFLTNHLEFCFGDASLSLSPFAGDELLLTTSKPGAIFRNTAADIRESGEKCLRGLLIKGLLFDVPINISLS